MNAPAKIPVDPRIADALAGRPFLDLTSSWTGAEWDQAIEYAKESGDPSELEYMLAKDDEYEAEARDEDRRNGCSYADYLYDNNRDQYLSAVRSTYGMGGVS